MGYINGIQGLINDQIMDINEETFAAYRNLGGYDYIGRSSESLEPHLFEALAKSC